MKKILINTPCLNKLGGVSNHYIGLKNKWTLNVKYNTIGSRNNIPFFILLPFDLIKFFFKCLIFNPKIVVINPSLQLNALRRDQFYLKISKLLGYQVVVFFHGWDIPVQNMIDAGKFDLYEKYKDCDLILVLAKDFKDKLIKWGFKNPIKLTTTKIDDDLIKHFSIGNKSFNNNILFLSRVEKSKGIFIVLKTFKHLNLKFPNIQLTIAGDGNSLYAAKYYVKKHDIKNVIFLGRISGDKLIKTFENHSIYFFPTYYGEGMPTSLLEAMIFGQVIISRPVGGIKDFFTSDMGYISNSIDPLDFEKIISDYIKSSRISEIGKYNHKYANNNFLASKVVKVLENYFINL
jgi:glycosyltransferase involved in cell wall biosynthesis